MTMTDDRDGQVVTFYSYKGGTGRTMALANVAWILATNGKRVLVVDWDLESPGLHRFFTPFLDPNLLATTNGVIDLIRVYENAAIRMAKEDSDWQSMLEPSWFEQFARVHDFSFSLDWDQFPPGATLDFISAGRQNRDYAHAISGINWDDFYDKLGGGGFLDALRADMKRQYDYALIDSRTGLSDVADICTIHLPDLLVDCFTLSEQGINGAKQIADLVLKRKNDRDIDILPVPMRIDPAEKRKADAGRLVAKHRFTGLPNALNESERDAYWSAMQIPYQAYYGYEESLATFGDIPGSPGSLLSHYEILTRYVTKGQVEKLKPIDDQLRRRINDRFVRRPEDVETEIVLQYAPPEQVWAEWIEHVLTAAGIRVLDPWAREPDVSHPARPGARELRIVSRVEPAPVDSVGLPAAPLRDPLVIYVADVPVQSQPASYAKIAGLEEEPAAVQVLRLVGRPTIEARAVLQRRGPRFPAADPAVFNVPTRNARFTGREEDLRRLRAFMRGGHTIGAGATAAALLGMGGLGKTHVALEYAHRFRAAYDMVYWITADPFTFIDTQLHDLATQIGVQPMATGPDTTKAVLAALTRGEPHSRWLLVYDNADDLRGEHLLPSGLGHVLITSRNPGWSEKATTIQLEVFDRLESITLIQKRNPALSEVDAGKVADALGDLPIAVSAASAWLADTGLPVQQYLDEIERLGPTAIQLEDSADVSVAATWKLSLQRLQERSKAAARLLELCSVLAPEVALELVHSDALAETLASLDPSVTERIVRGTLVQHLNRLALLRVDQRGEAGPVGEHGERTHGGQIIMHRLLQLMVRTELGAGDLGRTKHEIHRVLANIRPDGEVDDPETWPRFRMLWPHVEASEAVNCPDESVRRLMVDRVRYLWLRGDLERAQLRAESTDEAWRQLLEQTTDPRQRRSIEVQLHSLRFNHANILRSLGEFEQSRRMNDQALAAQLALLGERHPHALMTAGGLAGDLRSLGRYGEALELDRKTHATWSEVCGDDHPRTLAALNNLAVSHRLMGNFGEARERDEVTYQRRRLVLGDTHPRTLSSLGSLARDVRDAGEYERSVELLQTLVEMARTPAPFTSEFFNAKANLAVSLRSAGRSVEAAELLDEAVDALRASRGDSSPDCRAARLSRAVNRIALRQYNAARQEMQEIRAEYERSLGAKHPHTVVCMTNLGVIARAFSEHSEAIELTREAVETLDDMLGPDHPFTLDSRTNLAICLAEGGDAASAEQTLDGTLPRVTRAYGPDHPVTLRCRANLGLATKKVQGSDTDAEHARVLEQLARLLGKDHPTVRSLRNGDMVARTIDPHPF
jgi:cellulose biosynthesis protein BcsQ/tetratricopeptide (TPR) repeat protein